VTLVRMKPLALIDSSPAFKFSKYPSIRQQDTVISFTAFLRLCFGVYETIDDLPLTWFLVDFESGTSDHEKNLVKANLTAALKSQDQVSVWDYRDDVKPIESAQQILTLFFGFVTFIAMLIASFSLVSSMYTNVYEQTKEIGILRAIGIQKGYMRRIYLWEAFTLVFASSLLGIIIGSVVGYTLTLQRVLFTQLPIPFEFPWQILIVVFVASFIFALASSLAPIHAVMRKPIVNIMRFSGV